MNYQVEKWNNRTLFIFYAKNITFDDFSEAIDNVIKPDTKSKLEVTSWTQGYSFQKDTLEIYFEHFYELDPFFSFELLPRENNNEDDLFKLRSILENLSKFIH